MTSDSTTGARRSPDLNAWIGRTQEQCDVIDAGRAGRLQATLDDPNAQLNAGDALPPLWHWAYFWEESRHSDLGADGLAVGAGFLPPIGLPRIMWAGSRVSFPARLVIGEEATRRSTILKISEKQGRTGRLCFVTIQHEVLQEGQLCTDEEMDVVFREAAGGPETLPSGHTAPETSDWSQAITPDPVLLFRYSALTWNSHRIHYDREYVTAHEGYPGLIVHGPLLATLMIDLLRRQLPDARVTGFQFSALRPVFDAADFIVSGKRDGNLVGLWVADSDGLLAMDGSARIEV